MRRPQYKKKWNKLNLVKIAGLPVLSPVKCEHNIVVLLIQEIP